MQFYVLRAGAGIKGVQITSSFTALALKKLTCYKSTHDFQLNQGGRVHKGSCLCGAITFEVSSELPPSSACHCRECRKVSGHYEASADVPRSSVTIKGAESIT